MNDVMQLFSQSQPQATNQPPQALGPSLASLFGSPASAAFAPATPPDGQDKLQQMGMQNQIPMQSQSGNPAQARSQLVQNLQQKYGPNFLQHPEVIKMLEQMQKQSPIKDQDEATLTTQGKRTLAAIQGVS